MFSEDMKSEPEACIRSMLKINGENYYLLVGESFVTPTVPRENDPLMSETRMLVETICAEITKSLEKMTERREQKNPGSIGICRSSRDLTYGTETTPVL